jgi:hypothetical protein
MIRLRPSTGQILTILYFSLLPAFPQAGESALYNLHISHIDGKIRVQKPGSEGWLAADSNTSVNPGEKLSAGPKSVAELEIPSGGNIRLGPSTVFTFLPKYQDDASITYINDLQIDHGDIWVSLPSGLHDSSFAFFLPFRIGQAIIFLPPDTNRTIFRLETGIDSTFEAKVYAGTIHVKIISPDSLSDSLNNKNYPEYQIVRDDGRPITRERTITLQADQKLLVTSSGKIVFDGLFSSGDIDETTDWIEWNKSRDSR